MVLGNRGEEQNRTATIINNPQITREAEKTQLSQSKAMADGRSMHDYRIVVVGPGGVGFAFYPPPPSNGHKRRKRMPGGRGRGKNERSGG
jgi:hypothetical protein